MMFSWESGGTKRGKEGSSSRERRRCADSDEGAPRTRRHPRRRSARFNFHGQAGRTGVEGLGGRDSEGGTPMGGREGWEEWGAVIRGGGGREGGTWREEGLGGREGEDGSEGWGGGKGEEGEEGGRRGMGGRGRVTKKGAEGKRGREGEESGGGRGGSGNRPPPGAGLSALRPAPRMFSSGRLHPMHLSWAGSGPRRAVREGGGRRGSQEMIT